MAHSIEISLTESTRPHGCRECHRDIPAREPLVKIVSIRRGKGYTSKTTSFCCMECDARISRESEVRE